MLNGRISDAEAARHDGRPAPQLDLAELHALAESRGKPGVPFPRWQDLEALIELAQAALDPALFDRGALASRASLRFARAAAAFREPEEFTEALEPEEETSWSIVVEVRTENPDPVRERLVRWLAHEFGLRARTKTIRTDHMEAILRPLPSFQEVRPVADNGFKKGRYASSGHRKRYREGGGRVD